MRARESVREGWRDVVTGTGWPAVCAATLGVLLSAVVGLRVDALVDDVRAAHHWVAAGAATLVVAADGRVDGAACDRLTERRNVVASGAVRARAAGTTPAVLPRTAVPTYETTPGLVRLLTSGDHRGGETRGAGAGVLLSDQVADELGLGPGDTLRTTGDALGTTGDALRTTTGDAPVRGVYAHPDDGRDPALAYAMLAPTPIAVGETDGAPFDACWATIWPADASAAAAVRQVVEPSRGDDEHRTTSGQLNPRLGAEFRASSTESGALVTAGLALAAGLVVGVVAVLRRRLAIASDRHVGVPVAAQVVGISVQHALWSTVAASVAFAVVSVLVRGLAQADATPIVAEAGTAFLAGVAGAVGGGSIGLALVRERALHRYFRTR